MTFRSSNGCLSWSHVEDVNCYFDFFPREFVQLWFFKMPAKILIWLSHKTEITLAGKHFDPFWSSVSHYVLLLYLKLRANVNLFRFYFYLISFYFYTFLVSYFAYIIRMLVFLLFVFFFLLLRLKWTSCGTEIILLVCRLCASPHTWTTERV